MCRIYSIEWKEKEDEKFISTKSITKKKVFFSIDLNTKAAVAVSNKNDRK